MTPDWLHALLVVHAASTLAMCGVVWFVQIVHYPLFDSVGPAAFAAYESRHAQRTSRIVGPLMVAEAIAALALAAQNPSHPLVWFGLATLALIWTSTFWIQVPQHRRLAGGFDSIAHRRLVRSNWLRTLAWSARGFVALSLLS